MPETSNPRHSAYFYTPSGALRRGLKLSNNFYAPLILEIKRPIKSNGFLDFSGRRCMSILRGRKIGKAADFIGLIAFKK